MSLIIGLHMEQVIVVIGLVVFVVSQKGSCRDGSRIIEKEPLWGSGNELHEKILKILIAKLIRHLQCISGILDFSKAVQKAFLVGLFSGEIIFGAAYYWREFCVSKWVGLDVNNSFKHQDNSLKQLTLHSMGLFSGGPYNQNLTVCFLGGSSESPVETQNNSQRVNTFSFLSFSVWP